MLLTRSVVALAAVGVLCGCGSTIEASYQSPAAGGNAAAAPAAGSSPLVGGSTPSSAAGSMPSAAAPARGAGAGTRAGGVAGGTPGISPSGGTAAAPGGRATGSSATAKPADTSPIDIGFIVTKVSNLGSFGIANSGQTIADEDIDNAMVAAMNKRGGIDGRKIVPIYGVTDTAASNWSGAFQAACADFTQDHHVAAVVGYIFVYLESFESCLAKAGVPHLYGGYAPGDIADQSQFPTLVSTTNPSVDLHYKIGISGAIAAGLLTPKTKLGVMLDTCADDNVGFSHLAAPYLTAHHINFVTFTLDCAQGSGDDAKEVGQVGSAELRFRAEGVTTVFAEGPAALFFALAAETQGWHPQYLMTSAGAAFEGNLPATTLSHFHGFGWEPSADVDANHQPYAWTPAERRCLDMAKSEGLRPSGYNDYMGIFTSCDGLELYAAALAADGGQTSAGPVVAALKSVIGKTQLASVYGGRGREAADERGGPSVYRQWGWAPKCSCFEYMGPTYSVS
ncbi:MAG TPA: hypothetical protein VG899_15420 [Mycobacteriales bacterium]|nr:hypothetical protein [Mycobacteriales bacterium]